MAKSKLGLMRFEEDKLEYAGAFIPPPIIVFRFGIEVDEALRVGGSGFLGESDAGEAEHTGCRQNQKTLDKSFSSNQRR